MTKEELINEINKLKKKNKMLIEDLSCEKELQQQIAQKQREYYEENQKLKKELAYERTMLDIIKEMKEENKELKEIIKLNSKFN